MNKGLNYYKEICSEKTLQSNAKGFFMNFVEFVIDKVGENWIKNEFEKLKTDEDRIRFVFESNQTKELLENFLSNVQEVYRGKDAEFSQKRRIEGEKLILKNEVEKALILFSQSVLRAPKVGDNKNIDSGLSLPLALFARSQALMQQSKFSLAINDLNLALKCSLPENFKAQAFQRLGICHKALGEAIKAQVCFDLSEKLLGDNEAKFVELEKAKRQEVVENLATNSKVLPTLTGQLNPTLANASDKLKVKTTKEMGRFIVAKEKINTGDTLVVEAPHAACLLPECFGTHCQECFKRLESAIPCTDCSSLAFCSTNCRDLALTSYHKYECKFLHLLIGSGMSVLAHMALRMVSQNGLEKCLEIYKNRDTEKIYSLCSNAHLRTPIDFFQRTLMACFLLRCLQKAGFFGRIGNRIIPNATEFRIGAMLLFNLQMLQFNAHEIYETRYQPEHRIKNSKTAYIGVAVYTTASLFNHDCFLALTRFFVGKNIVLKATRPLEPNEIVPENYGSVYTRKSLKERKISLAGRYWFDCQCRACSENWPGYDSGLEKVSSRLRCPTPNCAKLFTLPVSNSKPKCLQCKRSVNLTKRIQTLEWCESQYTLAFEVMDKGDSKTAAKIICEALNIFYLISVPPHKETQLAEEMLRACEADNGNTSEILKLH